jgi:ribonuclease HI
MKKTNEELVLYTDGGSRGNPGPAALGVYIPSLQKRYHEYIGTATNNTAEYRAIVFALKKVKQIIGTKRAEQLAVEVRSDSQLIVNQLSGFFKLKEEELFPFFIQIWNLKQDFAEVRFTHVPREENKVADSLVNEALDEATTRTLL